MESTLPNPPQPETLDEKEAKWVIDVLGQLPELLEKWKGLLNPRAWPSYVTPSFVPQWDPVDSSIETSMNSMKEQMRGLHRSILEAKTELTAIKSHSDALRIDVETLKLAMLDMMKTIRALARLPEE